MWRDTVPSFAQYAARTQQQHDADGDTDEDDLQGGGARLRFGRHDGGDQRGRGRPDRPDEHRAQDRAAVVAGAADDEHGPDLEGEHRHVVLGRDEADEMRLHGARQPHDGAADGKGLQAEGEGILAKRQGCLLILADGAQHAAPRAAQQPLECEIDAERRHRDEAEVEKAEGEPVFRQPVEGPRDEADAERPAGQRTRD